MQTDKIILLGVFAVVPLTAFLFVMVRAYWSFKSLEKKGIKAQGIITGYEEYADKKSFFPVIKFTTSKGQEVHQRTRYGLNEVPHFKEGAFVEVIYSEKKPAHFMLRHQNPFRFEYTPSFLLKVCTLGILLYLLLS